MARPLGNDFSNYLGYAFLARPMAAADPRTVAAGELPKKHWFWSVVARFWSNYSHVAVAALIVNILALASPLFIMNVYDRVVPNGAIPSLVALAIGLIIAILFDFVLRTVRSRIIDMTGKTLDVVLAANIFEHVQAVKMSQRPTSVGVLANQLRDFDSVREFFTSGSVVSAIDLLFALLFIAVLFMIAGPLAWIPLFMLPLGVSAVTVGFGFLITLDGPPLDLRSSVLLIPIAQAMVALPLVVRTVGPMLRSIDDRQRQAAASLGAAPLRVFLTVDLPVAWRALLAAAGFAFAVSLGEFGATSFLVRDDHPTLPVVIYRLIGHPGAENFGMAMAASVVLAATTAAVMFAVQRLRVGSMGAF